MNAPSIGSGRPTFWTALALLLALLGSACSRQADSHTQAAEPAATATSAIAPTVPSAASKNSARPLVPALDVGKLDVTAIRTTGEGANPAQAVAQALRMAVLQVNGAALDSQTVNTRFGIDATLNQSSAALRASGFSEVLRQRSGGLVQSFRIIELVEPAPPSDSLRAALSQLIRLWPWRSARPEPIYKATIEAQVGKYTPSPDLSKVKLVIAPLRFDRDTIVVGERSVPAKQIGEELRQRIQEALLATGRFAILDREFNADVDAELEMIANGSAPRAELSKLSQAVSADVVWIGRIHNLAYNRHTKTLRTSPRELVSYSGGWSIQQKLVTVATKQVLTSDVLRGMAPATAPTTLSPGVNSTKVLGSMADDLVDQVVASILTKTFPVSIVSMEGNQVVLSQGGKALSAGARYAVAALGAEIKDPQTGQSLGRVEHICCELVVDRVADQLSYGRFERSSPGIEKLPAGSLLVRQRLPANPQAAALVGPSPSSGASTGAAPRPRNRESSETPMLSSPSSGRKDDDKW